MYYEKPKRKRRPLTLREQINRILITLMILCVVMASAVLYGLSTAPSQTRSSYIVSTYVASTRAPAARIPFPASEIPLAITFPERVFLVEGIEAFEPFVGFRVIWSPDGRRLAAAKLDGSVFMLDVTDTPATVKPRFFEPTVSTVWGMDWSPDGRFIASSGTDRRVTLWDTETMTLRWQRELTSTVSAVAFVPGRNLLSGIDYRSLVFWDFPEGTEVMRVTRSFQVNTMLDWTASGGRVVVAGLNHLEIFALDGMQLISLGTYSTRDRSVSLNAVAWRPDGEALALADRAGVVWLWSPGADQANPPAARPILAHAEQVNALAWSPDGRYLASAGGDQRVLLWDAEQQLPAAALRHDYTPYGLAWSTDGETLAVADVRLRLWPTALWRGTIIADSGLLTSKGEGK